MRKNADLWRLLRAFAWFSQLAKAVRVGRDGDGRHLHSTINIPAANHRRKDNTPLVLYAYLFHRKFFTRTRSAVLKAFEDGGFIAALEAAKVDCDPIGEVDHSSWGINKNFH